MNRLQLVVTAWLAAMAGPVLFGGPEKGPKPDLDLVFETRTRNPKLGGLPQLTPVAAGESPTIYRVQTFSGERHTAQSAYWPVGAFSATTLQTREKVSGRVRYFYNPATDVIEIQNNSLHEVGSSRAAPWSAESGPFPEAPVLSVEISPLSPVAPLGGGSNNPLNLPVLDAVTAADDDLFKSSVGGLVGISAFEFRHSYRMVLSEPESAGDAESRAKVTFTTDVASGSRTSIRGTNRAGTQWTIREVSVHYRIRACAGEYALIKTLRKRALSYVPTAPANAWSEPWTEHEAVTVESEREPAKRFSLPLIDDHEVELVSLLVQPIADCATCGASAVAGGSQGPTNGSIEWTIPLGMKSDGQSVGALLLHESSLSAAVFSPSALVPVLSAQEGEVIRDAQGKLRQILVPRALVDVVITGPQSYEIRFHLRDQAGSADANGIHVPVDEPYLIWRLENPGGPEAVPNRLRVTRMVGAERLVTEVDESEPGRRVFSEAGGLRVTETTHSVVAGHRVETIVVGDAAGAIASKRVTYYQTFVWGEERVKEVLDPDGAVLTTVWAFQTNSLNPAYGQLIAVTRPDGTIEDFLYDSARRQWARVSPAWITDRQTDSQYVTFGDFNGDGLVDQMTSVGTRIRLSTIRLEFVIDWGGIVAGHRRRDRYVALDGTARWDNPNNILTRERYAEDDGRLVYRLSPDGQLSVIARAVKPDGTTTRITRQGAAAPGNEDVIDGTQTMEAYSPGGLLLETVVTDLASGLVTQRVSVVEADALGRPTALRHLDGAIETRGYCESCGQVASTALRGVTVSTEFDALGRRTEETRSASGLVQSRERYRYDAEGRLLQRIRIDLETGAETVLAATSYDRAGRVIAETILGSGTTTYAYAFGSQGRSITITTYADGGTRIETRGAGGALLNLRGTTVAPADINYLTKSSGGEGNGYIVETWTLNDGGAFPRTQRQSFDLLGNIEFTELPYPTNARFRRTYDAVGRLVREEDPDGVTILYAYDQRGRQATTALDVNRNGLIDYAGGDRIRRTLQEFAVRTGLAVERTTTQIWETEGSDVPTVVSVAENAMDGSQSWMSVRGLATTATHHFDLQNGRTVTHTGPEGVTSVETYHGDRLLSARTTATDGTVLSGSTYSYDGSGRLVGVMDLRGRQTTYAYDAADRLNRVVTPDPDPNRAGAGYNPQTTTRSYDALGRVATVTGPDGRVVNTSYEPDGQLRRTSGDAVYPVEYTYDTQRRLKTMTTWRDFAGNTDRSITTWNYDLDRGWLVNKRFNDQVGPEYLYSAAGRRTRFHWVRGAAIPRHKLLYNSAGDLQGIEYADTVPNTPDISYTYDRLGRPRTVTDGAGTRTLAYHASGALERETYSNGLFSGLEIQRSFDPLQRPSGVAAGWGGPLTSVGYGYDAAARLRTVTTGATTASYTYTPGGALPVAVRWAQGTTERLATTRSYDDLDRLVAVTNAFSGGTQTLGFDYDYDAGNQRTRVARQDGSAWTYGYDARGQLTAAARSRSNGVVPPWTVQAWSYDDVGNRVQALRDGRPETYTTNALNHYLQRTVPGAVEILGSAAAGATVTFKAPPLRVEPQAVSRDGPLFQSIIAVDNSASARLQQVDLTAVRNGVGPNGEDVLATISQRTFVPRTPELFSHDADGNLLADARWTYTWDQQNRLVAMETKPEAVTAGVPRSRLEFAYDSGDRRVAKKVLRWDGAVWAVASHTLFVYDGWNLLAELDALGSNRLIRSYGWGIDLSGSIQGAGGVGGLLMVTAHAAVAEAATHLVAYDGNGNVAGLVSAADGSLSAQYDYDPFGEPRLVDGPIARANPFQFSTKYTDPETGLLYYGFRYYAPSTGRWLNRDPIGEAGGANPYAFSGNDALNQIDFLGLNPFRTALNGLRQAAALPFDILSGDLFRTQIMGDPLTDSQCEFLLTVTGIRNNREENREFLNESRRHPEFRGIPAVQAIYNPTFALGLGDFVQIVGDEIMTIGAVSRLMAKTIEGAFEKAKSNHCALECVKIFVEAHSQGGAIANRALALVSPEAKKHTYLTVLGGQEDASGRGLGGSRSIRNRHDIVPKLPNQPSYLWRKNSVETFDPIDLGYSKGSFDGPFSGHSLSIDSKEVGPYLKYRAQNGW